MPGRIQSRPTRPRAAGVNWCDSSGAPALRSPTKRLVSKKVWLLGTTQYLAAFKEALPAVNAALP